MASAREIQQTMRALGDKDLAQQAQRYFKTGKGEYGEGDKFLGIRVPVTRKVAKQFKDTNLVEIEKLLQSRFHEERLLAVIMLANIAQKADEETLQNIFNIYLHNTHMINNWDIVDSSAPGIVGRYLYHKDRAILYKLANSDSLWEKRIAILATFYFIQQNDFTDALALAELCLTETHDLIHKASGWMLREVGNKDQKQEEGFLKQYYQQMPRTMLRYAIEKFPEAKRQAYLKGKV
ncbi:MAG: DNA alkylation repair protein [Gammaproteobacteria bacterium]|nr:DNA alkylation repair protein [Gammaproteobacteria bacterium]